MGDFNLVPATTTTPGFLDSTGNNNDGTGEDMEGGVFSLVSTSTIDGGVNFNGVDDFIRVPENDILDPTLITLSAWFFPRTAGAGEANIVTKGDNSGYRYRIESDQNASFLDRGGTNNITGTATVPFNAWSHIVAVGGSADLRIYIDGVLDVAGGSAYGGPNTANDLQIGGFVGAIVDGGIDEFRVYSVALDAMDILTNYNYGVDNTTFLTFGSEEATSVSSDRTPSWFQKGSSFLKGIMFVK